MNEPIALQKLDQPPGSLLALFEVLDGKPFGPVFDSFTTSAEA